MKRSDIFDIFGYCIKVLSALSLHLVPSELTWIKGIVTQSFKFIIDVFDPFIAIKVERQGRHTLLVSL